MSEEKLPYEPPKVEEIDGDELVTTAPGAS
jgi:hypothetical protein